LGEFNLILPLEEDQKIKLFYFSLVWTMDYDSIGCRKERAMKNLLDFTSIFFWAIILLLLSAPRPAEDSKAHASETLREKAKEELEAVKKDSQKIGQDAQQSPKELPSQAGEEFKKTGRALKKTGKELKESTGEAVQSIKELLKK